jgi:hypothetical protein
LLVAGVFAVCGITRGKWREAMKIELVAMQLEAA